MNEIITLISGAATAFGVLIAAWQLWLAHRQTITAFEDSFAREYRELAATLPTKALLGDPLTEEEHAKHFDEFYHYFDLCNEQVYLHLSGRITKRTWRFWRDGIASNMKRQAFARAWWEIANRAGPDFAELRRFFPPTSPVQSLPSHQAVETVTV
ncbi:MAG: hypothetical protein ACKVY0_09520 [Prosthecobacter sp.]|uniref:hypothetical protein n=1 Tax=Prosthecobacter sp. TaxID=1965333 RepID=UPI0038FDC9BB